MVLSVQYQVNVSAVSQSLDEHKFFAMAHFARQKNVAWHCVRLHHACRVCDPPEAPCEHVGSLMHNSWNDAQNFSPGPLVDQVLLKFLGLAFEQGVYIYIYMYL